MADMGERILRQMKAMVNNGHHPITESYLNYVFEDLMDDYYGLLSKSEKKACFKELKQHFTIDKSAPDLWVVPDGGFETRVLEAFTRRLLESDDWRTREWRMESIFYQMLGCMIDQEQVHFTRFQSQDLYDKIRRKLNL